MTKEEQRKVLEPYIESLELAMNLDSVPSNWKPPEEYEIRKFTVDKTPVEHLIPNVCNQKVIVLFHGGGFVIPLVDAYREIAIHYSKMAGGAEVFIIDYCHAPKNKAPVALEEVARIYEWVLNQGYQSENIMFIGDSAGGNLAITATMYLRDNHKSLPKGVIAISPWACIEQFPQSRKKNRYKDVLIGENASKMYYEVMESSYFSNEDLKQPYVSPVYGNYNGFPSLLIQTGGDEILLDDSIMVAKAAQKAGVDVIHTIYEGQSHDFPLFLPDTKEGIAAWNEMRSFVKRIFE